MSEMRRNRTVLCCAQSSGVHVSMFLFFPEFGALLLLLLLFDRHISALNFLDYTDYTFQELSLQPEISDVIQMFVLFAFYARRE